MLKGLTLPNRVWTRYTDAEMTAITDLKPSVLVMLLYGSVIDVTHANQLESFIDQNKPRILLRPYRDDIPTIDPESWALTCDAWVRAVGIKGEVIPANEMNLPAEHGAGDWGKHIEWLKRFAWEWTKRSPTILHLPALSPFGGWLDGLRAYRAAAADDLYDRIDCHAYGSSAIDSVKAIARIFPGKPIDVTEFNGLNPSYFPQENPPCESATWFILGGTEDQSEYNILTIPSYYASFKNWKETPMADFTSPNHGGPRASTRGVVIHATLGGTASPQTEYDATVNWFNNPASEVSAHAVVGPNGQVAKPVHADVIAWHAKAANADHLGIEMAKAHLGDAILEDILETTAKIVAGWCHDYEIPIVWSASHGIEEHRNIPGNDHQDVGGPFDRADFLARVKKYAGQGDDLTDQQKTAVLDHLGVIWGESKADTIKKNPAESERAIHERVVAIKEVLGVN